MADAFPLLRAEGPTYPHLIALAALGTSGRAMSTDRRAAVAGEGEALAVGVTEIPCFGACEGRV